MADECKQLQWLQLLYGRLVGSYVLVVVVSKLVVAPQINWRGWTWSLGLSAGVSGGGCG